MPTVNDYLNLAETELAEAERVDKEGSTGMLGVAGRPAYHVNRAAVYATMALASASRHA